ncbi:glycosyltransferase family 2 protein [Candidatus Daviesbacteria bacterium]|nr:glycosyltransferase family 2 protein [Candidatus Daviesbacteria bacterium]
MDLSVIILSYNTKEITDECLNRLQQSVASCQTKLKNKIEVIVLDNASSDGSLEIIKQNHPWVELIESKENTGFSKGNNLAIKQSINPYVLFLNSDAYVENDTLEKAMQCFKNPDCDALGPKLVFENGDFQPSAGNLPNPFNIPLWILGLSLIPGINKLNSYHPKHKEFFNKMRQVGWVTGAFFMLRKKVLDKVGLFDENLFMYSEEIELCKRIKNAGFKIWYIPTIIVTHLHAASSSFDTSLAFINELKGLKYYFGKYYPSWYFLVKLFLILGLILRVIAFSLLKPSRARAYIKGLSVI